MLRRVVITGLGMVSPLANGVEETWERILQGKSGIKTIESFNTDDLGAKIAGVIPRGDGTDGTFNPDDFMLPKEQKKVDDFIVYGVAAAKEAIDDSGWKPANYDEECRTGVLIGSGIGGLSGIADAALTLENRGPRRISPFFIPGRLINLVSGHVSINYKFRGPNHSVVTACSTGAHAIGDAARLIALGDADVMVAGGAESPICRIGLAGFEACKALSTGFNETPEKASRPYDKDRDGFVMGEGAGIVVLEDLEHALARGAKIYGEVTGYGLSGDAHHITAPASDGDGGYRAMKACIERAGLKGDQIDYVNAHGTSTPLGDEIELRAVERLFGNEGAGLTMSSTKSATGHLLGGAGAIEAIFATLAIRDNMVPPTLNLENPSMETKIDLVPNEAKKKQINHALSNSFGFGGTNASLLISRYTS